MDYRTEEVRRRIGQEKFTMYRITGCCPHCGKEFTHNIWAETPILNFSTEWENEQ